METVEESTRPFMNHRSWQKGSRPSLTFLRERNVAPSCSILGLHRPLVACPEGTGKEGRGSAPLRFGCWGMELLSAVLWCRIRCVCAGGNGWGR